MFISTIQSTVKQKHSIVSLLIDIRLIFKLLLNGLFLLRCLFSYDSTVKELHERWQIISTPTFNILLSMKKAWPVHQSS